MSHIFFISLLYEIDVTKGYDGNNGNHSGNLMITLQFDEVTIDDYGYYECKDNISERVIEKFYLFIDTPDELLFKGNNHHPLIGITCGGSAIGKFKNKENSMKSNQIIKNEN